MQIMKDTDFERKIEEFTEEMEAEEHHEPQADGYAEDTEDR
jgi:hypothetical protein